MKDWLLSVAIGAIVTMGALTVLADNSPGEGKPTNILQPPTMTTGVTKTQTKTPADLQVASATPPVRALPAPGTGLGF